MVVNETANALVTSIGNIGIWIQAAGFFIILWLIFQIISQIWNWKRRQTLSYIKSDLQSLKKDIKRIEKKIDNEK